MPEPIRVLDAGNAFIVMFDDGSRQYIYPSNGGLWFGEHADPEIYVDFLWPFNPGTWNINNGLPDDGFRTPGRPTHNGLDMGYGGVTYGSLIGAVGAGVVTLAYEDPDDYGVQMEIDHGEINGVNISTFYAHMTTGSMTKSVGNPVALGETIGLVGSTGNSTGAHLHFVVYLNGVAVDPLGFMAEFNPSNEFVR